MIVKFLPSGEEHEIEVNETILHLAQRVGLHIQSVCKGLPSCAECRVQIMEGEHHVLPPSKKEIDLIGTAHYVDRSRLSCQLRCFGDVTVDLAEQIAKEKRATQKPRDRMARRDGKESQAVLGGILDNVVAADAEISEEFAPQVEKIAVESFKGDPNLDKRDTFYGDFYTGKKPGQKNGPKSQQRNRNKKKSGGGQKQKADGRPQQNSEGRPPQNGEARRPQRNLEAGSAQTGDKPKRKRNRNRKRKPGAGKGEGAPASEGKS